MTLINEKKGFVLSAKLALNNQLVFTWSNVGTETLEQVVKHVQCFNTLSDLSNVDCEKVNVWVAWIVKRNLFQSGTQETLKIGTWFNLLKLQKSGLPSTLAKMKITFLRITSVLSWFTCEFFCRKMWTNTTDGLDWRDNLQ